MRHCSLISYHLHCVLGLVIRKPSKCQMCAPIRQLQEPEPAPAAPGQPLGLGPLAWDHQRLRWMRMFHPLDAQQQVRPTGMPSRVGGV
jgi:hypothetical protein